MNNGMTDSSKLCIPQPDRRKFRRNHAEEAYNKLRLAIVSGELRPNQRLVESQISRWVGMSRTPVREALKRLEATGYLSTFPSGGLVVTDHAPSQIRSLYEVREALEVMAIKLACQRATEAQIRQAEEYHVRSIDTIRNRDVEQFIELNTAFHEGLFASCGNDQLISLVQTYRDQYFDRRIVHTFNNRDWQTMIKEHERILKAVRERNPFQAGKAVHQHLSTVMSMALRRF